MGATGRWGSLSTRGGLDTRWGGRQSEASCAWWGRQQQLQQQTRKGQTHGPAQSSTSRGTRGQATQVGHARCRGARSGRGRKGVCRVGTRTGSIGGGSGTGAKAGGEQPRGHAKQGEQTHSEEGGRKREDGRRRATPRGRGERKRRGVRRSGSGSPWQPEQEEGKGKASNHQPTTTQPAHSHTTPPQQASSNSQATRATTNDRGRPTSAQPAASHAGRAEAGSSAKPAMPRRGQRATAGDPAAAP